MENAQIPSVESTLVKTTVYLSPIYSAEFDNAIPTDKPGISEEWTYKGVAEDNFSTWLEKNCEHRLHRPNPDIPTCDGYRFTTEQGGHTVVHESRNTKAPAYQSSGDAKQYQYTLTIRSQPAESELPEGLVRALEERGYELKEK